MKKLFLMTSSVLLLAACGNGTTSEEEQPNEEIETTESMEEQDDEENENDADDSDDNNTDEHVEHQRGLKMDEPGIVEDNQDQKYEVTLNSVDYEDIVGGLDSEGETHAVVNITVKNLRDESFDAKNIFNPGFGPEGELQSSLNSILMDEELTNKNDVEQDLLEGEVAPDESVSGDHLFVVDKKVENYVFVIGGKGDQIITYAQWEVSEDEID